MSENKIYAEVQMVETETLKPNEYNPNIMTDEQFQSIVSDFQENGFVGQPIIITNDNTIIDGEHRWRAAKFLNYEKVPVVYFNPKDEDHQKMLTIGWNAKRGEFNPLKLAKLIQDLNQKYTLEELSLKLGFSASDLKDKLSLNQITPEFIEQIKKEADDREKEVPRVMNFAVNQEQEMVINEALELSIGKCKGEKLAYICSAYLNDNPQNGKG
ncbi:MAG: ParB/RepB/Spo0J family partition protein [Leadbetterella sp.]|nr:ParB/RepB/Spo0J family partition protein [Leadbetterella sp.]